MNFIGTVKGTPAPGSPLPARAKLGTSPPVGADESALERRLANVGLGDAWEGVARGADGPAQSSDEVESLTGRVSRSLDGDGKERPLMPDEQRSLASALSAFDPAILHNLEQSGLKVRVVDTGHPPPGGYPGQVMQWPPNGLGYYNYNHKTLVLRRQDLREGGSQEGRDTVHHEVAHAVDDMLSPARDGRPDDATNNDPRVQRMFGAYLERVRRDHSAQWSDYAATDPHEYYAEGVYMATGGERTRETLRTRDPDLAAYVAETLERAKSPGLPERQQG